MLSKESSVIILQDKFPRAYFYRSRDQSQVQSFASFKDFKALQSSATSNFGLADSYHLSQLQSSNDNTVQTSFKEYIKPSLPLLNIRKKISIHSDSTCKSQRAATNLMTEYEEKIKQMMSPRKQKYKWELPNPSLEKAKVYGVSQVRNHDDDITRASSLPRRVNHSVDEQNQKSTKNQGKYIMNTDWVGKGTTFNKDFLRNKQLREQNLKEIDQQLFQLRRSRMS